MRILFVSDAPSIHTRRWAEYFRDRGAEVHIASFRTCQITGVTVHLLPTFGLGKLGYFFALFALRKLYTALKPDVVHAQYVTSYGFLAALARLRPLIVTAWGTDVLIAPNQSRLMHFLASYAVRHAAAVTTVAQHMNASIEKLGLSATQVEAIPFGVDSQFFVPSEPGASERIVLKLICSRNFAPVYDVQTLIRALAVVIVKNNRRLHVDLVGDGPLRQSLLDLVQELKLVDHVHFLGHVNHQTLADLLASADIFVTPALSDGNNVSLNEAMACGCFPIATDIPANSQWLQDGQNGYLYQAGNVDQLATAIMNAMDDVSLRASAKEENRHIVETRADWRVCVKRMEYIYTRLSMKKIEKT